MNKISKIKNKKNYIFLIVILLSIFIISYSTNGIYAENGPISTGLSNIVNGSFENPNKKELDEKNSGYLQTDSSEVEGWETTAIDQKMELAWLKKNGTSPHMVPTSEVKITSGVGASNGWQFAETLGSEESTIYQSLSLKEAYRYNWTVNHRGRDGKDILALFICEDVNIDYVKPLSTSVDHFTQIINWLKALKVEVPTSDGQMIHYVLYSTKWLANCSFEASDNSIFSFTEDEVHTNRIEVFLMMSDETDWEEYTGSYLAKSSKKYLFAISSYKSASTSSTSGNLIDNISFTDVHGNNLLKNPGFDDYVITKTYLSIAAANSPSAHPNVGWSTTSSDRKIEIGNLKVGNAYGLNVTIETVVLNPPSIRDGEQFVELNANEESSLYQIVKTDSGKMYKWSLSHRGRDGVDTMALIIGPEQDYVPKKTTQSSRDQLMQIVDWLQSQNDVVIDIGEIGCSEEIKIYTSKFNNRGGYASSSPFSWIPDETHTEEWSVWIISSDKDKWHDYGGDNPVNYSNQYVVPNNQDNAIFGFVSVNSAPVASTGQVNMTYGNFLDNISFKEYYYVNANFVGNEQIGFVEITTPNPDDIIFDDDVTNSGWAIAGSDLSFNFTFGTRDFIGAYINGTFVPASEWEYDEVNKTYIFSHSNINFSLSFDPVYQAQQVIYDTCSNHIYQYDPLDPNSGPEVPMNSNHSEYISHAPISDDGWKFLYWRYIEITESNENRIHHFPAEHIIKYSKDAEGSYGLSIWNIGGEAAEVEGVPISKGMILFAEWEYRQRAISKTYDNMKQQYEKSTLGGTVDINVAVGTGSDKNSYIEDGNELGQELYAPDEDTYINAVAKNNTGFSFGGWFDKDGQLLSRNPSYTYKVETGKVVEIYAYFIPLGHNITINVTVFGETVDLDKYFIIECTFSSLRENQLYSIIGVIEGVINVNGEQVSNHTVLKSDESGNASIKLYVKHGNTIEFKLLPERCVFSFVSSVISKDGYSVSGEQINESLNEATIVDFIWFRAKQSSMIAEGKHYFDIYSQIPRDSITITKDSSFSFYVENFYNPSVFQNLFASLWFNDLNGNSQKFVSGTRILMIDTTYEQPKYYIYIVHEDVAYILLTEFTALGSNEHYKLPVYSSMLQEKLVFIFDYLGSINNTADGIISLQYTFNNGLEALKPSEKTIKIYDDSEPENYTVHMGVTSGNEGNATCIGPFIVNVNLTENINAVNTIYEVNGINKYSLKFSFKDKLLLDGSYAIVNGEKFFSHNGVIIAHGITLKEVTAYIYLQKHFSLNPEEKLCIVTELLPDVLISTLTYPLIKSELEYTCVEVEHYSIKAEVENKVLSNGNSNSLSFTVNYQNIDCLKVIITKKNDDNIIASKTISLSSTSSYTSTINNFFTKEVGETYKVTFVGIDNGLDVCFDVIYIVCGF